LQHTVGHIAKPHTTCLVEDLLSAWQRASIFPTIRDIKHLRNELYTEMLSTRITRHQALSVRRLTGFQAFLRAIKRKTVFGFLHLITELYLEGVAAHTA
jgi:hypothetical protein